MPEEKMFGYVGKILRINLTDSTTEIIPTAKYVPEYLGGKCLCNKIFWDEVGPGIKAYDPGNKLIFMTGPTTGTGIPTGGRSVMTGISANSLPEQYTSSSIGGFVGTVLKYAGYDGFIIEGKAPQHTYVYIEDDKVKFLNADPLWGMLISDTQESIRLAHGPDAHSMVIGPAGENLHRNATITTGRDFAFAKAGFGAVFGSKNLKAIAIKGTGSVIAGDIEKVFDLRTKVGAPEKITNPAVKQDMLVSVAFSIPVPEGWTYGKISCSPGCNSRCQRLMMDQKSCFTGEPVSQIEKCVSPYAISMERDLSYSANVFVQTKYNNRSVGMMRSFPKARDTSDPDIDMINEVMPPDNLNYYKSDFERGNLLNQLCTEYGLDKWDMAVWYFTWIGMAKKEGLLDDLDFGMEPDAEDPVFVRHFIESMVYRRGIGDVFAEGMARAMRKLGKEKYGDAIYHGRTSADGKQLDIPVSLESSWGNCSHWQGRGFQGTPKWLWICNTLNIMVNTRDAMSSGHIHATPDDIRKFHEGRGPSYSEYMIKKVFENENMSTLKDSITTCEWQSPDMFWPTMESEMFAAATGCTDYTAEKLLEQSDKGRLLFRAILMRNFERDRDMEVEEMYPYITYPDPNGEVATWDEWNDIVDTYYKIAGWDLETGWPFRSTWEKVGLEDVADEMEKIGKMPPEGRTEYVRKPNPIGR